MNEKDFRQIEAQVIPRVQERNKYDKEQKLCRNDVETDKHVKQQDVKQKQLDSFLLTWPAFLNSTWLDSFTLKVRQKHKQQMTHATSDCQPRWFASLKGKCRKCLKGGTPWTKNRESRGSRLEVQSGLQGMQGLLGLLGWESSAKTVGSGLHLGKTMCLDNDKQTQNKSTEWNQELKWEKWEPCTVMMSVYDMSMRGETAAGVILQAFCKELTNPTCHGFTVSRSVALSTVVTLSHCHRFQNVLGNAWKCFRLNILFCKFFHWNKSQS